MKQCMLRAGTPGSAFARVELLIVLCALALLTAIVLPALANPRVRSQRVLCANNLRQIGAAMQLWGHDHRDLPPFRVLPSEGGTRNHPLAVNPWLHYSWISNELSSPVALICPSDTGRPARDFSGDPAGGYVHPNFANRATSYLLVEWGGGSPMGVLAADRNVGYDGRAGGCSSFLGPAFIWNYPHVLQPPSLFLWNTNLHRLQGNLLRADGVVEQVSNAELPAATRAIPDNANGTMHYITPR